MSFCFSYCLSVLFLDVLLCHDDELEGRRVAFILYLVPPWQSSDGGTLNLYTTDSECPTVFACVRARVCVFSYTTEVCISFLSSGYLQPQSIVKSLVPSWNTLVLFEVSPVSFHQVRINILVFTISLKRLRLEITLFGVSFFLQVSEVLSQDKCRLSLSGWFHGPSLERPPRHTVAPVQRNPHLPRDVGAIL